MHGWNGRSQCVSKAKLFIASISERYTPNWSKATLKGHWSTKSIIKQRKTFQSKRKIPWYIRETLCKHGEREERDGRTETPRSWRHTGNYTPHPDSHGEERLNFGSFVSNGNRRPQVPRDTGREMTETEDGQTRRTFASDGSQSFFLFGMLELCVAVNRFVNIFFFFLGKSTRAIQAISEQLRPGSRCLCPPGKWQHDCLKHRLKSLEAMLATRSRFRRCS